MRTIKISLAGTPHDYSQGLIPLVISNLGYKIQWVKPSSCELQILGPFLQKKVKQHSWVPKPIRPIASRLETYVRTRSYTPLRLFHTAENIRHDAVEADYTISFDLAVQSDRHLRFPYWMEMVDWSHEGLHGNRNSRFGQLLNISKMMRPLGYGYLSRPQNVAIFSSHMREPRDTLVKSVGKLIPLSGFGLSFDKSILNHHESRINKVDVLQNFAYNLCPENGLYPGYYTEKIPEAFVAGCLPITWTDTNVCVDFNSDAFINLEPMSWQGFEPLNEILNSKTQLEAFADQPLLLEAPTLETLKGYLSEIMLQALS